MLSSPWFCFGAVHILTALCRDLRASIGGKDIPEDIKAKMLALHEDNLTLKESYKTAQEKLLKAKTVSITLTMRPNTT